MYIYIQFRLNHHCVKFHAFKPCGSGDEKCIICHVSSCDHVIKDNMILWLRALKSKSLMC